MTHSNEVDIDIIFSMKILSGGIDTIRSMTCRYYNLLEGEYMYPFSAVSIFFIPGVGSLMSFITVFMRQLGLSPSECAIIYGISPFLSAAIRPVSGLIADKLNLHRLTLMLCFILSSLSAGCMLLVPPVAKDTNISQSGNITFFCGPNGSRLEICNYDANLICLLGIKNALNAPHDNETKSDKSNTATCSLTCKAATELLCIQNRQYDDTICMTSTVDEPFHLSLPGVGNTVSYSSQGFSCMDISMNYIKYEDIILRESFCSKDTQAYCSIHCANNDDVCDSSKSGIFQQTFWSIAILYLLTMTFMSPLVNLMDGITYSHLGDKRGKWGNQRVWGTIGFAMFGVTSGFVMDAVSERKTDIDYTWSFVLFIILSLLAAVAVYLYRTDNDVHCSKALEKFREILAMPEVLTLVVLLVVFGMFFGIIDAFLFWHLQNLGAPQLLLGLSTVMICLPEIFIMLILGRIIEKYGEILCLYAVCFAYMARFLGYSILNEPWFVLLIEPLHGFTYGMMYGAATSYGSRLTPEGMHGTVQAIISTSHYGIGETIQS